MRTNSDIVIARAIDAIYEASTAPSLWPKALDSIASCTDDVGAVLIWARDDGSFGTICSPSLVNAQREYEELWAHKDIRAQRAVERSYWLDRDVITDQDVFTPEEIASELIYTQFLAKFGLRWVASVGVSPDPMLHAALTVQRGLTRAPFDEDEMQVISHLGTHTERALRIGTRLIEANATAETLAQAFRRMGTAIFVLGDKDRVLFKNAKAEQMSNGPFRIEQGQLYVRAEGQYVRFDQAVASQRGSEKQSTEFPPLLIHGEDGGRKLAFQSPMVLSDDLAGLFLRQSQKLIVVVDHARSGSSELHALRELFGLTAAEVRLAALVGTGASPREAAKQLKITEETARSVLKRIFSKTGTKRQSQVAALLGSVGLRGYAK